MYKLTFRIFALAFVVVLLGLIFLCMKQFPTALVPLPGFWILIAIIVAPIIVAFACYRNASTSQKIRIAVLGMAFGVLYGFLPQIHFASTRILPGYQVLINMYLLGFMSLGGALTARLLCKVEPTETGALRKPSTEAVTADHVKEEEVSAKNSSTKLPAQAEPLKPSASTSSTSLKGILDNLSPDDSANNLPAQTGAKPGRAASLPGTKAAAPTAPVTPATATTGKTQPAPGAPVAPSDSQSNIPEQKKATTGAGASSTATRLQAQKRKSTSTFTKLQALSASGTGGIRQKPSEQSSNDNDADSLKSILDRLDTKQDDAFSAPEEVEMDSLFGQESLLSPPEVAEPVIPQPAQVVSKPSPPKQFDSNPGASKKGPEQAPSLSSMLDSLDAAKKDAPAASFSPAAKTSTPATTGGAQTTPKPAMPGQPKPAVTTPQTVTPAKSDSGTNKPATPAQPVASKPATPQISQSPTPTSSPKVAPKAEEEQPKSVVKAEPVKEPAKVEAAKTEPVKAEGLFETGLDKEIDDIFSSLVPAEAQKVVQPTSGQLESYAQPDPLTDDDSDSIESLAPEESLGSLSSLAPEPEPAEKDVVFETKIDQELDDIFSNLVPAEAQKEVSPAKSEPKAAAVEAKPIKPVEVKTEAKPAVEVKPPIEAKPVVEEKKAAPKEEPKVVSVPEPEPIKAEVANDTVLEESGLDRELDDIFSSLAPSEAQRSVTHETLARVRAADVTGDHPAISPENTLREKSKTQEEISFAPPSETEAELSREEQNKRDIENIKPGKFNETLQAMPSLQSTVEGLLNSLAASEAGLAPEPRKNDTESFAPPETPAETFEPPASKEPANGAGVATKVMDLLESLEAEEKSKPAEEKSIRTSQAEESAAAVETSGSGDVVNDLFAESTREAGKSESKDELITESVTESSDYKYGAEEAKENKYESGLDQTSSLQPEKEEEEEGAQVAETPSAPAEVAEEADEAPAVTAQAAEAEVAAAVISKDERAEKKTAEKAKESEATKKTAKELKEFGRLSSKQNTADFGSETAGTMKTIGKLLIEVQAVENIIKAGESGTIGSGLTTARVISAARGEGIKALLSKIDSYVGVDGSVIVGHDGLVIASTAGPGMDKDTLGVLSVACLSTSNLATKKLEIGKLRQMVLVTDAKTTVLTDVDVGILAVFLNNNDIGKIDGLLEAIHDTIHG
jgi:hypothetical protein